MNAPAQQNSILFAPGRIVQGDLYEPNTTDMYGKPLTISTGPNKGNTRVEYFFKVAIPKTAAQWWSEPWGQQILVLANSYWPQGQVQHPKFAWKIEDGDDTNPNFDRQGRKNCDTEGFVGCWVIKFSSGFATKIFDAQGQPMLQPGLVKRGYWVEVWGTVNSNEDATRPGIFINHNLVAFRAPDKEISSGPDPRAVGFGKAALPAGVSAAPPPGAAFPSQAPAAAVPGAVPATAAYTPPAMTPGVVPVASVPAAAAVAPIAVQPSQSFLTPGTVPAAPTVPVAPPAPAADPLGAPVGYRMTNAAGARYEQFTAGGWTIDSMLAAGHMVKL